MFPPSLRDLVCRVVRGSRRARRPRSLLSVERLEDRLVPAPVSWDGGPTGTGTRWDDAVNWSNDMLPGPNDDVTINRPGVSITYDGASPTVNSLSLSTTTSFPSFLNLRSGSLRVTNALTVNAVFTLSLSGAVLDTSGLLSTFTVTNATFNYNSGTLTATGTGTPLLVNAALGLGAAATDPVTFVVRGTSSLNGNVKPGQTLLVQAVTFTSARLTVSAGTTNAGMIRLDSLNTSLATPADATLFVTGGTSFINLPGGIIETAASGSGSQGSRFVTGNLINQGQITATATTLSLTGGTFEAAGGTIQGTAAVVDAQVRVSASAPVDTTITLRGNNTLLGNNLARTTLLVQAVTFTSARLTVSAGTTNAGMIRLDSLNTSLATPADATLFVTGGTSFINLPGGIIETAASGSGSQGSRFVTGNLINQGQITAAAVFVTISAGTFEAAGGTIQGTVGVLNSPLRVSASPPIETVIAVWGNSTLLGNNLPRTTLYVFGSGNGQNAQLNTLPGATNAGTIVLDTISGFTTTLAIPANNTLTNLSGGMIEVRNSGSGARTITGNLINAGTVQVNASLTLGQTGAQHVNSGIFRINNNAQVTVLGATLPDIGFRNAPSGQLLGAGTLQTSQSNFLNEGLVSADLTNNTLALRGGTFLNFNPVTNTLTGGRYRVAGILVIEAGTGSILTNAAAIELTSSVAAIRNQSNVSLLTGFATNAPGASFTVQNLNFTPAATFRNDGTLTAGVGSIFNVTNFTNNGTVNVQRGTLRITGSFTNYTSATRTLTGGTYQIVGDIDGIIPGLLQFPNADIVTNAATIVLDRPNSRITDTQATPVDGLRNFAVNASAGSFTIRNGRDFTTSGNFTNDGSLTVCAGTEFRVTGTLTNLMETTLMGGTYVLAGTLRLTNPDIQTNAANVVLDGPGPHIVNQSGGDALANLATNAATGVLTIRNGHELTTPAGGLTNNGRLNATGRIVGSLTNAGQLHPGGSPGLVTITGNYTQTAAGSLNIEIGGLTAGSQFDQLMVNGVATLAGTLNVSRIGGFVPVAGNSFPILTFTGRSSDFTTYNGLIVGNGLIFTPMFDPVSLTLTTTAVGLLQFSTAGLSVMENGGPATLTVTRTNGAAGTVAVTFATSNGSAFAGADYTATSGTLTFGPGQTSATIVVPILDDTAAEGNETFNLTLSNPTGGAGLIAPSSVRITIIDNETTPLLVRAFTPTSTGFFVDFNQQFDNSVLSLYDALGATPALGPPDVTVTGSMSGAITGSLVVDPNNTRITFLRTGPLLPADTFTVTLRSADNGFKTTAGLLLDGNADGTPGDNFFTTFTVTPSTAVIVSVPDFSRGPGQPVILPAATGTGLPLRLSNGAGVDSVDLMLRFDPALLTITGAALGPGVPAGAVVEINTTIPGEVRLAFSSPAALPAGPLDFVILTAQVPTSAGSRYTQKHVLDMSNLLLNEGLIAAVDDDGIHVNAYFGDTTGNGGYASLDAQRVLRVAVGLDSGFDAYQLADPVLIADISGNGTINSTDATRILQEALGIDQPQIPALPPNPPTIILGGPDPFLNLPTHFKASPGEVLTVPVALDLSDGLESVDLAISFDPRRLEVVKVQRGDLTGDFDLFAVNLEAHDGTLRAGLSRSAGPIADRGSGSVLEITFRVRENAPAGPTVLNLRRGIGLTTTQLNEGGLDLIPDPSDEEGDVLDGLITVLGEADKEISALVRRSLTRKIGRGVFVKAVDAVFALELPPSRRWQLIDQTGARPARN